MNSISLIYSEHFIEHLSLEESLSLLRMNEGMRAWGHQYLFDRSRLTELLLQAGSASVAGVPWGRSCVN
jgi:hypothetical protein